MKRNKILTMLMLVLCAMTSCKDFLDLEPKSALTDENFWKTQDDVNTGVVGMYALLRAALNNASGTAYYAYGDFASDEINSSNTYPFSHVVNMNWGLAISVYSTTDGMYLLRRYDLFYRVIDEANRVIKYVESMDASVFDKEATRNHLLGEAYYMRAFSYFYMGRIWGGVPILTEAVLPIDAQNHAPAMAEEVMAQCLADIEIAESLLGWNNLASKDFAVRANRGAALALEAHVNAWTGNYEAAAIAADSVLKSGLYSYVSRDSIPYHTIYQGQSSEGIFEISQNAQNEGTQSGIGQYTLAGSKYHRTITVPMLTIQKARIDQLYADRADKRRTYVMDTTVSPIFVVCNKYANLTYSDETNNAVPIYKNNMVIFRYSDIKLLLAESLALKAGADVAGATTLLNEVRLQAGLPAWDGNGSLVKAIFDERARELFLEGHRYYDMVRLYKYGNIFEFSDARMSQDQFRRGKYIWPFDPSLLNTNPYLSQTPFWSTVGF